MKRKVTVSASELLLLEMYCIPLLSTNVLKEVVTVQGKRLLTWNYFSQVWARKDKLMLSQVFVNARVYDILW